MRLLVLFLCTFILSCSVYAQYPDPEPCSGKYHVHDLSLVRRSDGTYFLFGSAPNISAKTSPSINGHWKQVFFFRDKDQPNASNFEFSFKYNNSIASQRGRGSIKILELLGHDERSKGEIGGYPIVELKYSAYDQSKDDNGHDFLMYYTDAGDTQTWVYGKRRTGDLTQSTRRISHAERKRLTDNGYGFWDEGPCTPTEVARVRRQAAAMDAARVRGLVQVTPVPAREVVPEAELSTLVDETT